MREFGIAFSEGLRRGLRAFPNPNPGEEQLVVCYNMMPTETGLIGHEELTALGITAPFVNYLAIKDQNGVVWYWLAGYSLDTTVFDSVPDLAASGFMVDDITPITIPYWLQVDAADSPSTQMYIWPQINGDPIVHTAPPAVGTGYDIIAGLNFHAASGFIHRLAALSTSDIFWTQIGG